MLKLSLLANKILSVYRTHQLIYMPMDDDRVAMKLILDGILLRLVV